MSIVKVELKYSNTGSEQLFYMEKLLIHQSGFPGHYDLWDLRISDFFFFLSNDSFFFSSYSVRQLQGVEVNAVVIENPLGLRVRKRFVCQKSVMSSRRRKGKVCCGSVLAGFWAVYQWLREQKHPLRVPYGTAVLWRDFTGILVDFEFGASCPVLLLMVPSVRWTRWWFWFSSVQQDSTSGCLSCLEFLQFFGQRGRWWVPLCD